MEIELNLPYAETYIIPIPQKIKGSKAIETFIKQTLSQRHPGFSSECIWDYYLIKDGKKKTAKTFVITKDFYVEKRLLKKNCIFYSMTKGRKKIKLFSAHKFTRNGEIKKKRLYILLVLIPLIAAAAFGIIKRADRKVYETEKPVVQIIEEAQTIKHPNIFDLINICCEIFERHEVFISAVEFSTGSVTYLEFSAEGSQPFELIKELDKEESVKKCICQNIVYKEEKQSFEIKIETKEPFNLQQTTEGLFLLEIQGKLSEEFKKAGAVLVSGSIFEEEGRLSFIMTVNRENLGTLNEKINSIFVENNIYTQRFTEVKNLTDNTFLVNIEGILLKDGQIIENQEKEERLSKIFIKEKKDNQNFQTQITKEKVTAEEEHARESHTYQKIGTVKKDGKILYYYRTEENRIYISEEEL